MLRPAHAHRRNAGFYRPGRYCPDARRDLEWQDEEDDVQRWLRLTAHLGAPPRGDVRQTLREARELLAKAA